MSNLLIVLLLALACSSYAMQTFDGRHFRGEAKVSALGPHMKIHLSWDSFKCRERNTPLYEIIYYDDLEEATTIKADYLNTSLTIESPIPNLGPLNILFWNKNKIIVWANCAGRSRRQAERFVLNDVPGELLPVESIDFEPLKNGGIVTWTLSKLQNAATHVLVKTCRSPEEENCTRETAVPITETNYTVEGLTPGVAETMFVRLEKQQRKGGSYYSDFVKSTIEPLPPTEEDFPSVENLTAEIAPHGLDDSDVNVSYTKPQAIPPGNVWWGIEARIVDLFGNVVLEGFRTQESHFVKTKLNLFTDMTVTVRAIYTFKEDEILSEERSFDFYTGIGHLAKPEFRVDAIDDTKALVRWTHAPKDTFETNFTISWDGGNQKEVLMSKKTYAVIDDLTPGQTYSVNITAHIDYESKRYESPSDTKTVKILSKDALKPRASCSKVGPGGLDITWEVEMPDDPRLCRFSIRVCPENMTSHCLRRFALYNELREATVDFFRFENQTVEVVNTCNYFYDVIVEKVSDPLSIFGAFKPSAVENLTVISLDDTRAQITFDQIEDEARFVEGYKIRWLPQGSDISRIRENSTSEKSLVLDSLEPNTVYEISVAPFTSEENRGLIGFEAQAKVLTQLPLPPGVTDLHATPTSMTYDVSLDWKMPQYDFDILFEIEATCGTWMQKFTTDSTSFNITVTANHGDDCKFEVRAVTNVPSQPKRTAKAAVATFKFGGVEPPQELRMIGCPVKYRYDFEIVPPESAKSLDIRYQFAQVSRPYESVLKENLVSYTAFRSSVPIEVKARICCGGVCSTDKNLRFVTNSAGPGAIDSMKMTTLENTNILLNWTKPLMALGPIDGYLINIRDEETKEITALTLPGNETSYTFKSDREHVEYRIEYSAFNDNRCGPGRFFGIVTSKNFLTSGEKFPPPKELHTGPIGIHQRGIYWNPPEQIVVKKYHIVGTPSPSGNYVPEKAVETVNRFTVEPRIPFSFFKPFTQYAVEISSCAGDDVRSCGRSFPYKVETDVGRPGKPTLQVAEEGVNTVSVIMTAPAEPAGPLDGYRVAYIEKSKGESPKNWEEHNKNLNFVTLNNLTDRTEYVIHVQAFNLDVDNQPLYSPVAEINAETQSSVGGASATMIVVGILLAVLVVAAVGEVSFKVLKRRRSDDAQPLTVPAVDLPEIPTSSATEY